MDGGDGFARPQTAFERAVAPPHLAATAAAVQQLVAVEADGGALAVHAGAERRVDGADPAPPVDDQGRAGQGFEERRQEFVLAVVSHEHQLHPPSTVWESKPRTTSARDQPISRVLR